MRARAHRIRRLAMIVLPVTLLLGIGVASAQPRQALRTVVYHGYTVQIPRSWPVFNLDRDPQVCVRFNRHALYLGTPTAQQRCPADTLGRTEAILLSPSGAAAARSGRASGGAPATAGLGGSVTSFLTQAGVQATATWWRDRSLIARALHRAALPGARAEQPAAMAAKANATAPGARAAAAVYNGLGFDACSAPSTQTMSAWGSSPYRAIGVYIGGANAACAQPNLTAAWASTEVAAGWHLILTYVGLQAPSNSCGCAGIAPAQASAEGTAAAQDAVTDAQSIGIPAGNPIYDDMEDYSRTGANTSAVLAFLSAWTTQLHAEGYLSGVYSNDDAGIADLVNDYGTGYPEPDDVWIAAWNNEQTTTDAAVPATEWANGQRLHQYQGGHNETYGGATINIDNDYLDGATADTTTGGPPPVPPPTLAVTPASNGTTSLNARWSAEAGLASWQALAGTSVATLTPIGLTAAHGTAAQFAVRSAAPFFAVQALGSSGQVLANSWTVATPAYIGLYGLSAFVSESNGVGGIPAGCYTGASCHIATTITAGRTVIASTGTESIVQGGTGTLFFKLTPQGRTLLMRARGGRLAVKVSARDASGKSAAQAMTLIPFATSGTGPSRRAIESLGLRVAGLSAFVFAHGAGGILAGCDGVVPCKVSATVSVGRMKIAATGPESVGGDELGYLIFSLTAKGRQLLDSAAGNQLGARVTLTDGATVAGANVSLVQFN